MAANQFDRPKEASLVRIRLLIAIMATLCPLVCYMSRQNLSFAIVSMVKEADLNHGPTNNTGPAGKLGTNKSQSNQLSAPSEALPTRTLTYGPKYDWTAEKSLLFEAFFWTYVLFQIPAARLAEKIGAKWILFTATFGSAIISLLTPLAASKSVYVLALLRALMGVCQTALFPACYVLYSHWLPPAERSQALPLLGVGVYVGSIITSTATGYFSEKESLGWEYAFYMPGFVCAIWSVLWIFIGASEPRQHKFISLQELEYIDSSMPEARGETAEKKRISWSQIVSSQAIWAMSAAFISSNWAFSITLLLLPTYLNDIMHISPLRSGMINSVIYILFCISSPIVGAVSTLMIETRAFDMSRLQIRKLFQCSCLFGQALCFIVLPQIFHDVSLVYALLFTQIILYSFVNGGEVQLPSDLTMDFAGTIYAIGNCVGSSTGFIVPRIHSLIVTESTNETQWNTFFYSAAVVTSIGGLIFLLFARNDLHDFSIKSKTKQSDVFELCQEEGLESDHKRDGKRSDKEADLMKSVQSILNAAKNVVLPPPPKDNNSRKVIHTP